MKLLEGGCKVPIAICSKLTNEFKMIAKVWNFDGSREIRVEGTSDIQDAMQLSVDLANQAISQGAKELFEEIRDNLESN